MVDSNLGGDRRSGGGRGVLGGSETRYAEYEGPGADC
jgi:hypothetical protein